MVLEEGCVNKLFVLKLISIEGVLINKCFNCKHDEKNKMCAFYVPVRTLYLEVEEALVSDDSRTQGVTVDWKGAGELYRKVAEG